MLNLQLTSPGSELLIFLRGLQERLIAEWASLAVLQPIISFSTLKRKSDLYCSCMTMNWHSKCFCWHSSYIFILKMNTLTYWRWFPNYLPCLERLLIIKLYKLQRTTTDQYNYLRSPDSIKSLKQIFRNQDNDKTIYRSQKNNLACFHGK